MLASGKSALALLLYGSTDFNFHSASLFLNINDNTNYISVIKINDIIRLEIPLDVTTIDSEMIKLRWHVVFVSTGKVYYRARSDS